VAQSTPPPNDQRTRQFLLLLGQHERRLRAFILSLVPNWADADDIGQEVKIRLWEQFDSYDPAKDFGVWARAIAHYQVLSHRERQTRESKRMSDRFVEAIAEEASRVGDDLDAGQQALKDCFDKLPAAKRDLLVHYYSGERTTREIAAEMGRTFDATRQAILRTRIALRDCVEETLNKAAAAGRRQPEEKNP
jgi:RNA polymerase sigma-70 factor, ECF subfamily